jgi:hypothetical protein
VRPAAIGIQTKGVNNGVETAPQPGRNDLIEQREGIGGSIKVVLAAADDGAQLIRADDFRRAVPLSGPS